MSDCPDSEMRDLLPELLHDRLPADQRARVEAHVATCAPCRAEKEIIAGMRAAIVTPRIDSARVAAAVSPYRSPPRRIAQSSAWRIAAAVVLLVGGGLLWSSSPRPPIADTMVANTMTAPTTELAVGDPLTDLSESDLRNLLDEVGAIEAVTSEETDVLVLPGLEGGA